MKKLLWVLLLTVLATPAWAVDASWIPPTQRVDNSPLPASEIASYELWAGNVSGGPYQLLETVSGTETSVSTQVDKGASWYFVLYVIDTNGNRSDASNEGTTAASPPEPGILTITITIQVQ